MKLGMHSSQLLVNQNGQLPVKFQAIVEKISEDQIGVLREMKN